MFANYLFRLLNTLRSIRFNIGLIAALAIVFALGTLIPQRGEAPQEVEKFLASHSALGPLFEKCGFFGIYHTPLVIGMLALLSLDIWLCRVWPRLKELRGFRFGKEQWGSLTNHVGLVIVLAGALMKAVWGFEEFIMIIPGQDKAMERFPASTVSLFDFKVDFYPGTKTPRLFESDFQASVDGETKRQKLRVNEPLSLAALPLAPLRFYQASWGATGMFKSVALDISSQKLNLKMNEPVKVPGTQFKVSAKMMLPDFTAQTGRPDTKSLEWNNPAVAVVFEHQGFETHPVWLLLNNPEIAFEELPDGSLRHAPPPPFSLTSIEPVFFSGIQAAYDPGFPVIVAGVLMMLTGFFLYLSAKFQTL